MTSTLPTDKLLLTAREAAAALSISERTLWTLTKCGAIAHVRAGRRVLYSPADLAAWIDRQRSGEAAKS
jgi:excisionase family DNA binding protein